MYIYILYNDACIYVYIYTISWGRRIFMSISRTPHSPHLGFARGPTDNCIAHWLSLATKAVAPTVDAAAADDATATDGAAATDGATTAVNAGSAGTLP